MVEAPEIFSRIYARHGHRCPMSTLGGRLGLAAMKAVGGSCQNIQLVYSNRTCAVDGIAETTGCTEDAGSLIVQVDGRHTLSIRAAGLSLELELSEEALQIAGRYRSLVNRLEKGWDDLDAAERDRRQAEKDAMLDDVLPQLWQADDEKLIVRIEK